MSIFRSAESLYDSQRLWVLYPTFASSVCVKNVVVVIIVLVFINFLFKRYLLWSLWTNWLQLLRRHSGVGLYQSYGNYDFWSVIIDILDIWIDQISLSFNMVSLSEAATFTALPHKLNMWSLKGNDQHLVTVWEICVHVSLEPILLYLTLISDNF